MSFSPAYILALIVLYLSGLFAVAHVANRGWLPRTITHHPATYVLSLGVFGGAMATNGVLDLASRFGYSFILYYAGVVLMFVFLASIGASADIWKLVEAGPLVFVFALIIVGVHMVLLFGVGKLLKLDLAEIIMASAVCIGGPSSAPALASAKGWKDLLVPGVLAGAFGYAIGSFIGISVVEWLR